PPQALLTWPQLGIGSAAHHFCGAEELKSELPDVGATLRWVEALLTLHRDRLIAGDNAGFFRHLVVAPLVPRLDHFDVSDAQHDGDRQGDKRAENAHHGATHRYRDENEQGGNFSLTAV